MLGAALVAGVAGFLTGQWLASLSGVLLAALGWQVFNAWKLHEWLTDRAEKLPRSLGAWAVIFREVTSLKNSRAFELEADHSGWELLKRAKMNPHGMISFFQILKKEQNVLQKTIEENLSFLSTHPETEERIQVLNALWQKEGKTLLKNHHINLQTVYSDTCPYYYKK